MVSTFLEKKNIMETSEQEEEVVINVALTVYGGSCLSITIYTLQQLISHGTYFTAAADTVS